MTTTIARTAAQIIARARDQYAINPETEGGADAFDFMIATEGIAPYGELYQEAYAIANAAHPMRRGAGQHELDARKRRAADLWEQVLPELERYADRCRKAEYTGWSRESSGPIRRVR